MIGRQVVYGRRMVLAVAGVAAAGVVRAQVVPDAGLVAAATREGTAVFHTSIDLSVAQKMVNDFQGLYPGIRI